jgi:ribosomal protein S18 acetylase RimI-like enzyme
MPGEADIRLIDAEGPGPMEHIRSLFRSYAAEFAGSIAESLCFRGFEAELPGLPGRYGPPGELLLLAMDDEHPVGCVALRRLDEATCEMKRRYIVPGYRGQRLGKRLVEGLVLRATRLGYRRMVLDTLPEMVEAIRLYRSLDFVETDRYWDNPIERTLYSGKWIGSVGEPIDSDPRFRSSAGL